MWRCTRASISPTFLGEGPNLPGDLYLRQGNDPRVVRYVDRANEFDDSQVVDDADSGRTVVVEGAPCIVNFPHGTDGNGRDSWPRIMTGAASRSPSHPRTFVEPRHRRHIRRSLRLRRRTHRHL